MSSIKFFKKKLKKSLSDAKYRSRIKKIEFNLTYEHLRDLFYEQESKCFYTGVPFNFESKTNSPSLDRIDSDLGYTIGNVVWCRSRINFMKYNDSYTDFLLECRSILEHRPEWKKMRDISNAELSL